MVVVDLIELVTTNEAIRSDMKDAMATGRQALPDPLEYRLDAVCCSNLLLSSHLLPAADETRIDAQQHQRI